SSASRWAGSARPRRWRRWPSISPPTSRPSPPAPFTSSTAALRCDTQEEPPMKLLRYGPPGQEKPGLLDRDGKIRDLSGTVRDIDGGSISPASLDRLRRLDPTRLPLVVGSPRLGPCVAHTSKVVAIGLNYRLHAEEAGM